MTYLRRRKIGMNRPRRAAEQRLPVLNPTPPPHQPTFPTQSTELPRANYRQAFFETLSYNSSQNQSATRPDHRPRHRQFPRPLKKDAAYATEFCFALNCEDWVKLVEDWTGLIQIRRIFYSACCAGNFTRLNFRTKVFMETGRLQI